MTVTTGSAREVLDAWLGHADILRELTDGATGIA
jgi:hypothetical protein